MAQPIVRFIRVNGRVVPIRAGSALDNAQKGVNKSTSTGAKVGALVGAAGVGALLKNEIKSVTPFISTAASMFKPRKLGVVGIAKPSMVKSIANKAKLAGNVLKPVGKRIGLLSVAVGTGAGLGALYGSLFGNVIGRAREGKKLQKQYGNITERKIIAAAGNKTKTGVSK